MKRVGVYIRVRPPAKGALCPSISLDETSKEVGVSLPNLGVNEKSAVQMFKYDGIFGLKAQQESVFETVAKPVVDAALQGINGTIFAYGQTGSGKTFTMTGGSGSYAQRGVIPRALSHIFETISSGTKECSRSKVRVAYLEIYNDVAFDLLSDSATRGSSSTIYGSSSEGGALNRVSFFEDQDGSLNLKNLSWHSVSDEADALNYLFIGDNNRIVSATPMNEASSRSHCIFVLEVETPSDDGYVKRAKVHLVDLAGSERFSKSATADNPHLFQEGRSINLALHYLEQVIVAINENARERTETRERTDARERSDNREKTDLNDSSRPDAGESLTSFIPYRNSLLTQLLKDSLGGNCVTNMIATVSAEESNMQETISTLKFASRVSCIRTRPVVNQVMDSETLIASLRRKVSELQEEITLLKSHAGASIEGSEGRATSNENANENSNESVFPSSLRREEIEIVAKAVNSYFLDIEGGAGLPSKTDPIGTRSSVSSLFSVQNLFARPTTLHYQYAVLAAKRIWTDSQLRSRKERNTLREVNNKDFSDASERYNALDGVNCTLDSTSIGVGSENSALNSTNSVLNSVLGCKSSCLATQQLYSWLEKAGRSAGSFSAEWSSSNCSACSMDTSSVLADRPTLFRAYCEIHGKNPGILDEAEKSELDSLCQKGKSIGLHAANLKANVEKWKHECRQALASETTALTADSNSLERDKSTESLDSKFEQIKQSNNEYQESIRELKVLKSKIEAIQKHVSLSKSKLDGEFEAWRGAVIAESSGTMNRTEDCKMGPASVNYDEIRKRILSM